MMKAHCHSCNEPFYVNKPTGKKIPNDLSIFAIQCLGCKNYNHIVFNMKISKKPIHIEKFASSKGTIHQLLTS